MSEPGAQYRTGIVVESKPGFVKVQFPDLDGLTSNWLATSHASTLGERSVRAMPVGNQVGVIMDGRFEDGQVIGARHSDADPPAVEDSNLVHEDFGDGLSFQIDKAGKSIALTLGGCAFTISAAGIKIEGGDLEVDGIKFKPHKHGNVQVGSGDTGEAKA